MNERAKSIADGDRYTVLLPYPVFPAEINLFLFILVTSSDLKPANIRKFPLQTSKLEKEAAIHRYKHREGSDG
jgi:hypothetical protein